MVEIVGPSDDGSCHNRGDVIVTASVEGVLHELANDAVWRIGLEQSLANGVIGNMAREAVGTQEQGVVGMQVDGGDFGVRFGPAHRAAEHIAQW